MDDFEITVDMGDEFFTLPYSFWKDERPVNWQIIGEGRKAEKNIYVSNNIFNFHGYAYFKIKNGYVKFSAKNFSPDREFYAKIPRRDYVYGLLGESRDSFYRSEEFTINGYKFSDRLMIIGWDLDYKTEEAISEAEKLSDFELEIIRNFPFAEYGYDFSRKDLKDYFSKFFWYYPKGKVNVPDYEYKTRTEIINGILEKRKKRK